MSNFLFLAQGPTLNSEASFHGHPLKVCHNLKADQFESANPELWDKIKNNKIGEGIVGTEFDVYSLVIVDDLKLKSSDDWGALKPFMFSTIFVDTKFPIKVWELEDSWNSCRSKMQSRAMQGFIVHPMFRYWIS